MRQNPKRPDSGEGRSAAHHALRFAIRDDTGLAARRRRCPVLDPALHPLGGIVHASASTSISSHAARLAALPCVAKTSPTPRACCARWRSSLVSTALPSGKSLAALGSSPSPPVVNRSAWRWRFAHRGRDAATCCCRGPSSWRPRPRAGALTETARAPAPGGWGNGCAFE